MENILSRYRNLTVLVAALFLQVLGLAVQVERPAEGGSTSLLRSWVIGGITPVQKAMVHTQDWMVDTVREYFYLRNVRSENRELRQQLERVRIENVRLAESAQEARRLQGMLDFTDRYIAQTVAARVIGSSGSEASRLIYINKGTRQGVAADMAVITPEGVVGKVVAVFPATAQVLLINDQSSGMGVIVEGERLQGVVRGMHGGYLSLLYILQDEPIAVGDRLIASGGDRVFPKGFPVGTVAHVSPGGDLFHDIRVKPAAPLNRLEEVLVVTRMAEEEHADDDRSQRAADLRADRLPSVPPSKPPAQRSAAAPRPAPDPEAAALAAHPEAQTSEAPPAEARTQVRPPALPAAQPENRAPQDAPR